MTIRTGQKFSTRMESEKKIERKENARGAEKEILVSKFSSSPGGNHRVMVRRHYIL